MESRAERVMNEVRTHVARYDLSGQMGWERWQAALRARFRGLPWDAAHRVAEGMVDGFSTCEDTDTAIEYALGRPTAP